MKRESRATSRLMLCLCSLALALAASAAACGGLEADGVAAGNQALASGSGEPSCGGTCQSTCTLSYLDWHSLSSVEYIAYKEKVIAGACSPTLDCACDAPQGRITDKDFIAREFGNKDQKVIAWANTQAYIYIVDCEVTQTTCQSIVEPL